VHAQTYEGRTDTFQFVDSCSLLTAFVLAVPNFPILYLIEALYVTLTLTLSNTVFSTHRLCFSFLS